MLKYIPFITLTGLFGAYSSAHLKTGGWFQIAGVIAAAVTSGCIWLHIAWHSKINLAIASAYFDIVYTIAYVVGLVFFAGQPLQPMQMLGLFLAVIGLLIAHLA